MKKLAAVALLSLAAASPIHAQGTSFWEGGYVGGQIGYTYGDFSLNLGNFDNDSVIGGLTLGYLWAVGSGWYLGPEFQYDFADVTVVDPNTGNTATLDQIGRLKLIAGREVGSGFLYGSIGYAYGNIDGLGGFLDGDGDSYVLGLGYDWQLTDTLSLGGEYQFQSFKNIGTSGGDVDVNSIYIKLAYRF
ncbi:outer membrane protein [Pukyongiella litopenaei]|uniref:Porin family protein n=1 Tax=Pukyongiella litopenaei TaxID=2605946 RepID=A0A2S0MRT6_9RHOB|nr:outer membrane beta-barrel protein [Pukyongiella litopenaei]AVO38461.1 porin family protein [Pukyongiella litopenaei]